MSVSYVSDVSELKRHGGSAGAFPALLDATEAHAGDVDVTFTCCTAISYTYTLQYCKTSKTL